MRRAYNSTIVVKKKTCRRCGEPSYIFSKGRCKQCATIEDTLARMEDETEREMKQEGLWDLIKTADDVYSKWLRLSSSDRDGNVSCYTCGAVLRWQSAHCGHFIKRGNLFLRFDTRNTRVQDEACNVWKDGNIAEYTKRLESEHPGITSILYEEAALVYKPTREEIRSIINEYTNKLKLLKQ
jgi:hypothetical protein